MGDNELLCLVTNFGELFNITVSLNYYLELTSLSIAYPSKIFFVFEILSVATQLTTPVMGISYPGSFGKDCFDMLSSIGYGDLVRLFSSLCFSVLLSQNLGAFT